MADVTEAEWLTTPRYQRASEPLRDNHSTRKWRCFACACVRLIWDQLTPQQRAAVEINERFADGLATNRQRADARAAIGRVADEDWSLPQEARRDSQIREVLYWALAAPTDVLVCARGVPHRIARIGISSLVTFTEPTEPRFAELVREIFANPFRPPRIEPAWKRFNNGAVVHLAQTVSDEQDFDQLPILADALEDAGCSDAAILEHCRRPGGHVRGCWVLDLILGKK
jgi:hypothetical protein